jgi:hypothetical protein
MPDVMQDRREIYYRIQILRNKKFCALAESISRVMMTGRKQLQKIRRETLFCAEFLVVSFLVPSKCLRMTNSLQNSAGCSRHGSFYCCQNWSETRAVW